MIYFLLLFLLINSAQSQETSAHKKPSSEVEENAKCCAQHLSCCRKSTIEPTDFEVRALLIRCENPVDNIIHQKNPITTTTEKRKRNTIKDDDLHHCNKSSGITNCKKKIKLTVKVKNCWMTNCKNQYIVIDHVFDSVTQQKQKLLNPYVLKIKQKPVLQSYELSFESVVNGEAQEKVHNKQEAGYTGCSASPFKNPTCGVVKYKNQPVPYSTGFCCSCDKHKSHQSDKMQRNSNFSSGFRIAFPAESLKETRSALEFDSNAGGVQFDFDEKPGHNIQKRGGQDCGDKYTPPNLNPDTYHQSAHCLQFSDIWYSVYHVGKPQLQHSLTLQLFEKYQDPDGGGCKWRDPTKSSTMDVGTDAPRFINEQDTLSVHYASKDVNEQSFALNHKIHKLLVPDASDVASYPELRGGPSEYLVVKESEVQANGKSCNVAGVGYEAFAKQPARCSVSKGTCLKNQPRQMWRHDHELEAAGRRGKYFLRNFGVLADGEGMALNGSSSQNKTLRLFYTDCYTSLLDIEFKADSNTVLRPNSLAVVTEVHIDSSDPKKTSITAKIFNSGLVSGVFLIGLTDCPLDLPATFNNINSKPALIPPQHQHIYKLELVCPLPLKRFFCSLQVLNEKQELIALRKVRVQRGDRCVCLWHCSCACLLADEGLRCNALSLDSYHAAGFQGGLLLPLHVVQYTFLDDMISMMLYILLFLCIALLLAGLTKAIIGCFYVPVGLWGLDIVLDLPKKMTKYQEIGLSNRKVVYNEKGWPIHPDTKQRVRNVPLPAEFCTNVIFFMVYPFGVIWAMVRRLCFGSYASSRSSSSSVDGCYCGEGSFVQRKNGGLQNSLVKKSSQALVE